MSATASEQKTAAIDPELTKRLAAFAGTGADRRGFDAPAPVSAAVIKQMTDAVGDRNPVYADEAFARRSIHKGLVAPPLWLYSWMMPGLAGLLGRYPTDWTGPDALVRAHELRLGRPNYAGDTMRLAGSVRSAELVDEGW